MTRDHDIKRAVRARMKATGERYTVAHSALVHSEQLQVKARTSQSQGGTMNATSTAFLQRLDENGFALIRAFATPRQVAALREVADDVIAKADAIGMAEYERQWAAGKRHFTDTSAIAVLSARPEVAWLMEDTRLRDVVGAVKGRDARLQKVGAIVSRPGTGHQGLHQDAEGVDGPIGTWDRVVFVLMLTPHRAGEGAVRAVPGSHRMSEKPFPDAPSSAYAPHDDEVHVEGEAGDLCVYSGHLWKSGTFRGGRDTGCALLVAEAEDVGWG